MLAMPGQQDSVVRYRLDGCGRPVAKELLGVGTHDVRGCAVGGVRDADRGRRINVSSTRLIGFGDDPDRLYAGIRRSLRDRESLEELEMPAGYMFHDLPSRTAIGRAGSRRGNGW